MAAVLESVQIAFFPGAPVQLGVEEISKVLFDQVPERIETRPAEAIQTANVAHLEGNVQITVNPFRIDVIFQGGPSQMGDMPPVFGARDVHAVRAWIDEAASKLFMIVPGVIRVGVVVTRSSDFESQDECNRAFAQALPEDVRIPGDVEDPAIQFNRRSKSEHFEGAFNVMSAWQLVKRQDVGFINGAVIQSVKYSVRSVLDANTPQAEQWATAALGSDQAHTLISELVGLAFGDR